MATVEQIAADHHAGRTVAIAGRSDLVVNRRKVLPADMVLIVGWGTDATG